jgi:hypothetical protein
MQKLSAFMFCSCGVDLLLMLFCDLTARLLQDVPDPFNWVVYDPFNQFGEATCTTFVKCPKAPTAQDQFVTMPAGTSRMIRMQVTGAPPLDWLVYSPPGSGNISEIYPNNSVVYSPNFDFCSE